MKNIAAFIAGFILASLVVGSAWYFSAEYNFPRRLPTQISFESQRWKEGDSGLRGQMYQDAVRFIEKERPSKERVMSLFGPSGFHDSAYPNGAEIYLVYQIDLGQRIAGSPYLDKIGIAFHKDGSYSHIATWD
jgi:hypothetical protein